MLGEDRREFHRQAVADTVKWERDVVRGWSQEDLADRLGVDRRQVVRLEAGDMPVTLEVVEELSRVFGVPAFTFFYSAVVSRNPAEGDLDAMNRWAEREIQTRFEAALEQPDLVDLIQVAAALPERDVTRLRELARTLLRASFGPPENEIEGLVARAALQPRRQHARINRRRRTNDGKARKR